MQSVTKEGLSFGDENVADVKKREKHYKKVFAPLAEHLKDLFKGKISKVSTVYGGIPALGSKVTREMFSVSCVCHCW